LSRQIPVQVQRPKTTSDDVDESDITGRNKDIDELLHNLLEKGSQEDRKPFIISLGMGGIGKSTLAQLAYNHHEVLSHFQIRMWVCVSDPFDQCKVVKAIIQEINPKHKYLNKINEFQTLLHEIPALIKEVKKFFLVLDDVWNEDSKKWEPFKNILKCGAQGSRILVTTLNKKVADIMGSAHIINLEVLSDEDCWLLFRKIAFLEKHEEQPNQLEDLGKQIANRCKGLPAKTLGRFMRFKRSREDWDGVLHSNLWKLEDVKKDLFAPLLLSFYELPLQLKRCFLYCAVFPKDYIFSRDHLVFLWMA